MSFKYVSLFSGVGGFEQALNQLDGECVMASEIDKHANRSYELLYGEPTIGDVTKIEAADVPDHDMLVGGFPCQAFSVAGNRGGFEDARGTLFFEVVRIAGEKQPKVILLENVKGLVSHGKGTTLDTIVKALNECGYRVDFDIMNSKYFGVPQNRERIFIVALREDLVANEAWNIEGKNIIAKGKRRIAAYEDVKTFNFSFPEQKEVTTRLVDVLEDEVDDRYYLSEEKVGKLLTQLREDNEPLAEGQVRPTLTPDREEKRQNGRRFKDNGEEAFTLNTQDRRGVLITGDTSSPKMVGHADIKGHDAIKRFYDSENISPALTTMGGGHREPKIVERKGLAIREATKKGYDIATPGDAVNYQFPGSKTRRGRVGEQIANTLEAASCNQGVVTTELRIRKLTPRECFRLQGFSDSEFDKLVEGGLSNTQLYKQAGNAVTVDVIHALACRLTPYL